MLLREAGFKSEQMETRAELTSRLEPVPRRLSPSSSVQPYVEGQYPRAPIKRIEGARRQGESRLSFSKLLKAEITLDATLES